MGRVTVEISRRSFVGGATLATTVPRVVPTRAPTTNAAAFDAIGDSRADATGSLNEAAQAVPDSGGILYVPPGRYRITSTIALKSGTTLIGSGATIFAGDERHPSLAGRSLVTNVGCIEAAISDHEITVRDIAFEYVAQQLGDAHAVQFRKVKGIIFNSCIFSGGGNATAFLACRDTQVIRCVSQGTLNCAYDHWEGSSNCVVRDCVATCAQGYGILFTGVGTTANDHHRAINVAAVNNRIHSPTAAGIWVCALSQYSSIAEVMLRGNHIWSGSFKASGIGTSGDVHSIAIEGNIVEDINGGSAIFVSPDRWNRPHGTRIIRNRLIHCDVDKDNVALIQALGDDVEVAGNLSTGGRFPSMVWADGAQVVLRDNMGDGLTYSIAHAINPAVADP